MPSNLAATVSLPFQQLIGSPIVAIIQAEAMAAQASAQFIESIGFEPPSEQNSDSIGSLKRVTFTYEKEDVNGNIITDQIALPVLSLVPIPLLQIKDASLEFNLNLTEVKPIDQSNKERSFMPPLSKVLLKGIFGKMNSSEAETKTNVDMKLKINIVQSDIPVGLSHLFTILDRSIHGKNITASSTKTKEIQNNPKGRR